MNRVLNRSIIALMILVVGLFVFSTPVVLNAAPPQQAGGDPVIVAAGDISKCNREEDMYTGYLLDTIPGTVLSVGDNAYEAGSIQEFNECYGPTWGRHFDRIKPVPGNHEYLTGGANGYFTYFGDVATPLDPGCRKECGGYYSFNVGSWHIVALNSEIATEAGSPQEQWLRADLAANPTMCTLAFWHRPRWSSGHHLSGAGQGLYQALYDYGADVLLSGHDHDYERFAPQDPSGQYAPDRGIRQFVVGTGGDELRGFEFIQPNSEVRNSDTWGVIKMTLHEGSYDWEFVPIPGQTFTDSGTANCVTAPGVPTAPVITEATITEPAVAVNPVADNADTGDITLVSSGATPALESIPAGGASYTVKEGDTLSVIGAQYGLSWTAIATANGLTESSILQIGQVIRLPGVDDLNQAAASTLTTTGVSALGASSTGTSALTSSTPSTHTVQTGDTLFGLAAKYGVTRSALAAANGITETGTLKLGQILTIPGQPALTSSSTVSGTASVPSTPSVSILPTTPPAAGIATPTTTAAPAGAKFYTVQDGDTIITIALDHNLDWQELLELNGLKPDSLLQIGQQIRLQ